MGGRCESLASRFSLEGLQMPLHPRLLAMVEEMVQPAHASL